MAKIINDFVTKIFGNKRIRAKDLLEKKKEYNIGDFVTINDNKELKAYVIIGLTKSKKTAKLGYLALNGIGDDIFFSECKIRTNQLLYLGDSFVTVDSPLWELRETAICLFNNKQAEKTAIRA